MLERSDLRPQHVRSIGERALALAVLHPARLGSGGERLNRRAEERLPLAVAGDVSHEVLATASDLRKQFKFLGDMGSYFCST